ncbi:MAG TPA: hypothetical protein IAB38_01530 [Candidatus Onthousia excrementipullorum]|uniref:Uncharacterized protein n=1 Tax=Candidatus Onthousia excrementipullorum TaxID=2840884 RepID=A0A9D1DTB4_9FIRM|nr:hypothetical protein [Candidatus Onthousia excrementipullorum]
MKNIDININKYVDLEERYALYGEYGDYIDKYIIYSICADNLGISFSEIRDYVNSAGLKLTEEEITIFLKDKEKEDKQNNPKEDNSNKTKSQIFADNFMKKLKASTYELNPTTLEYFNMYLANLKQNAINLVNLVENIGNDEYKELFDSLDIDVVEDKINYEDAIRLCKPIIYNVLKIREMEEKANNKETYLTFSVSRDYLRRDGLCLSDVCPPIGYQLMTYEAMSEDGYIELTDRQKRNMIEKVNEELSMTMDMLSELNYGDSKRLGYINKNRN